MTDKHMICRGSCSQFGFSAILFGALTLSDLRHVAPACDVGREAHCLRALCPTSLVHEAVTAVNIFVYLAFGFVACR